MKIPVYTSTEVGAARANMIITIMLGFSEQFDRMYPRGENQRERMMAYGSSPLNFSVNGVLYHTGRE